MTELNAEISQAILAVKTYKAQEEQVRQLRLEAEQKVLDILGHPETHVGTETLGDLKVTYKHTKKVDADKVRQAISEGRLTQERAGELFRWKPEINARAAQRASELELSVLLDVTTSKPAKPSFAFKSENKEK